MVPAPSSISRSPQCMVIEVTPGNSLLASLVPPQITDSGFDQLTIVLNPAATTGYKFDVFATCRYPMRPWVTTVGLVIMASANDVFSHQTPTVVKPGKRFRQQIRVFVNCIKCNSGICVSSTKKATFCKFQQSCLLLADSTPRTHHLTYRYKTLSTTNTYQGELS